MNNKYVYPENLKSQTKLWLWSLRDIIIIGICLLLSVLAIAQLKFFLPLALTLAFMFFTIRLDDNTVLDFIIKAVKYFIASQQYFVWQNSDVGTHSRRGD